MTTCTASMRALLVALVATAVLATTPVTPPAAAQDTSAVAVNTRDGSTLFRFAFSIKQIMGDVVDQQNVAIAYANCEECTTVAISVQVLLVSGSPSKVTPTNLAVALNEGCTECQTLAAAYQFVFGNGETLRFTAEGRRQIADIRRRFRQLRRSGLSVEEIKRQADMLAGELRNVLRTEVTTRGSDEDDDDAEDDEDGEDDERSDPEDPATPGTTTTPAEPSDQTPPMTTTPATTQPAPTRTTPESEPQDAGSPPRPTSTQP